MEMEWCNLCGGLMLPNGLCVRDCRRVTARTYDAELATMLGGYGVKIDHIDLTEDQDVCLWVYGVLGGKAGSFVTSIAESAAAADGENYPLMRPLLLRMMRKYPEYSQRKQEVSC